MLASVNYSKLCMPNCCSGHRKVHAVIVPRRSCLTDIVIFSVKQINSFTHSYCSLLIGHHIHNCCVVTGTAYLPQAPFTYHAHTERQRRNTFYPYAIRRRQHNRELTSKSTHLAQYSFIVRMLYKDMGDITLALYYFGLIDKRYCYYCKHLRVKPST